MKNEKNEKEAINVSYVTEIQNNYYSYCKIFLFNNKLHKYVYDECNSEKLIKQKSNKTI